MLGGLRRRRRDTTRRSTSATDRRVLEARRAGRCRSREPRGRPPASRRRDREGRAARRARRHAHVNLVGRETTPRPAVVARRDARASSRPRAPSRTGSRPSPRRLPPLDSTRVRIGDRLAEHLKAAAHADDRGAAACWSTDPLVEARRAQPREIADRVLGAGQDDEVVALASGAASSASPPTTADGSRCRSTVAAAGRLRSPRPPAPRGAGARRAARLSSASTRRSSAKGNTPRHGAPVLRLEAAPRPSSKSVTSPRNLLIEEAAEERAAPRASGAPPCRATDAKTPPRSMSATSTHGAPMRRDEPEVHEIVLRAG